MLGLHFFLKPLAQAAVRIAAGATCLPYDTPFKDVPRAQIDRAVAFVSVMLAVGDDEVLTAHRTGAVDTAIICAIQGRVACDRAPAATPQ